MNFLFFGLCGCFKYRLIIMLGNIPPFKGYFTLQMDIPVFPTTNFSIPYYFSQAQYITHLEFYDSTPFVQCFYMRKFIYLVYVYMAFMFITFLCLLFFFVSHKIIIIKLYEMLFISILKTFNEIA